jgi:surface protein
MFYELESVTSLDLSNFNTSNVVTMGNMFYKVRAVTFLDLSSFDTSMVTGVSAMFGNTDNLALIDATGWDVSSVTSGQYSVFLGKTILCDQGGSPGTGSLFAEPCT